MIARLMLFTRYPVAGAVKTRLIPALGAEGAAELHRRLTERIVAVMRSPLIADVAPEVRYTGGTPGELQEWLGAGCEYRTQGDGDLGDRLRSAFAEAFLDGTDRAAAIGADTPGLSAEILRAAFVRLGASDVVLGPTFDGGYYLIGMRRFIPELFEDIPWGTETVLDTTLKKISDLSLSIELLERLSDIDRPEDLDAVTALLGP